MKRAHLIYFAAVVLPLLLSCTKIDFGDGPGVGPDDNPPVGAVDETAGFYVRARRSASQIYYTHKNEADFSAPCVASGGEKILCIVEGEELDVFHSGVTLQHNAPGNMCYYLARTPYYYARYRTGAGPGAVQVDTDSVGAVGVDLNNDGVVDQPVVTCAFNFTGSGGPNCCLGNYSRVERKWNGTTRSYDITSSVASVPWGGNPAACLGGPGATAWPLDPSGFPQILVGYVASTGQNQVFEIGAPISHGKLSNISVANYFDIADHAGAMPLPIIEPYYKYQCLDRSYEVVAEIDVMIREWNSRRAFNARESNPTGHSEVGFEDPPFNTLPINDFKDWKDIGNVFPGALE